MITVTFAHLFTHLRHTLVSRLATAAGGRASLRQQNGVEQVVCLLEVLGDIGIGVHAKHFGLGDQRQATRKVRVRLVLAMH